MFQEYFAKRVIELLQNQKKYEAKERELEIISRLNKAMGDSGYDLEIVICSHENCNTTFLFNSAASCFTPKAEMCRDCGLDGPFFAMIIF
jgi:hypothetical protein